jgi:hypothetical protein
MNRSRKRENSDKEETVSKKATKERGGLCCPHCADSKYPCVTMEKQMRKGEKAEIKREGEKKTE